MKQLLCTFLFLHFLQIQGQQTLQQSHTIDSLKNRIATAQHDTIKINAYNAWDNIIYLTNPQLDQELNHKIVDIAINNLNKKTLTTTEKIVFKKSLALALNSLGIISYNKGENSLARDYYSKSLKIRTDINDLKGIAATLNNIGIVYQDQAENAKAIDYYTRSLRINEEIGDRNGEANCLSNIGRIYYGQKELDKALDYQMQSLEIREKTGDKKGMAIAYNNIGSIYLDQKNPEKAIEYFNRYLKIGEEIGDKNKIAIALDNIGAVYEAQDNLIKALEYYNRSLTLFKNTENKKWESALLVKIGSIYVKIGNHAKASELFKNAIKIAQTTGQVTTTKDASHALYSAFKTHGDYKEALSMHELYIQMRDSIINETNQKEILKQELKYNYDKQNALAEKEHEKELEISAERQEKQKIIIYSVTGILLLVIFLSLFIASRLRYTRKQNKIIEIQKSLVEEKQKEIVSSITYAKRLQEAMLPTQEYIKTLLPESFIFYKPKDIVAGDFYWIEQKEGLIYIAVADCTGHGIPGAIISVICSNALNRAVIEFNLSDPGKILDKTRELVLDTFSRSDKDVKDGMDISLLCIDKKQNIIQWSGANTPLWYVSNGNLIEIKADKQPIGKTDKFSSFKTHSIPLLPGSTFYLFSDGYADQFGGPNGKKFKSKLLKAILLNSSVLSCSEQNKKIEGAFYDWIGAHEQIDDICLIGLRI